MSEWINVVAAVAHLPDVRPRQRSLDQDGLVAPSQQMADYESCAHRLPKSNLEHLAQRQKVPSDRVRRLLSEPP